MARTILQPCSGSARQTVTTRPWTRSTTPVALSRRVSMKVPTVTASGDTTSTRPWSGSNEIVSNASAKSANARPMACGPMIGASSGAFHLRQIVVGCDLLRGSRPAIAHAFELARRCDAVVHLLHTIEAPADNDLPDAPFG